MHVTFENIVYSSEWSTKENCFKIFKECDVTVDLKNKPCNHLKRTIYRRSDFWMVLLRKK